MLADQIRSEWTRSLVQRNVTCPRTGDVLDVRTCVVLIDADGDPREVYGPRILDVLAVETLDRIHASGWRLVANPYV